MPGDEPGLDHAPPPLHRTLRELLSLPLVLLNPFRRAAKGAMVGRGRPVVVIPGLVTGDISTTLLRRTLAARGFVPEGWGQGLNTGADPAKLKRIAQRLERLHEQSGEKVILIGWSLGGLYARVLGLRVPEHVAMVITVASPFSGDRRANRAWRLYEAINDHTVDNPPFSETPSDKPPVPTVAIWSALDGVVAPACTRGLAGEADVTMRVDAPHFALGTSAACIEKLIESISLGESVR